MYFVLSIDLTFMTKNEKKGQTEKTFSYFMIQIYHPSQQNCDLLLGQISVHMKKRKGKTFQNLV